MTDSPGGSPWILNPKPQPWATVRLFCFPHAGGGASLYRTWASDLPDAIDVCPVQLPGRENRIKEPPFTTMSPLIERLATVLLPWLDRPFAFFGHSMGAFVAFELAHALRRKHGLNPVHLFASGCRAPHVPDPDPPIHALPEPEFVGELRALHSIPEEVLDHPQLRQLVVPLMRADMTLVETYTFAGGAPLDCPLSAFGGQHDPQVSPEALASWREHTRGLFRARTLPGEHLFLRTERTRLLSALAEDLSPHLV